MTAVSAGAAEPKHVLLVQSFGSAATPFTARLVAFETELIAKMGDRVDLDEVSLDMARYADRDIQEAIVNYLQKRQAKWQPDLVVPIGSSATQFVASYRDRLFPEAPVLYVVDQRLLPPGALEKNAAYVGQEIELPGLLEDMLRVAPATKNVAVIVGTTPLEHYWHDAFQKAAEPLAGRINFTYYDDLSFDQMKERVSTLPADSYIIFLLLVRDAAGVTLNSDDALQRLHAVAHAPINSIFDHQLGMGIVGGRLYQSEGVGKEAADIASRILDGESPSSISPRLFERLPARYDWRELQRWKINERLLPPGSTVLFRALTAWQQYRGWIIAGISICIAQALLISVLLINIFRRRRAEGSLLESEARFQTMANAAPVLIWMSGPDKLCTFFNKAWLDFTGRTMEQELGNGWSQGVHTDDLEGCLHTYTTAFDARKPFDMGYRLRRHDGEYRHITDTGAPRYGSRENFRGYVGACVDVTDLLKQQKALHESEQRVALATEAAHLGVWERDLATNNFWISDKGRELFQFDPSGPVTYKQFRERAHPEDLVSSDFERDQAIERKGAYEIEYRILLPDGTVRWIAGRARCILDENGNVTRLLGVSMDVTERKQAQELFQLATEASTSGILLIDDDGRIVLVNAQAEKIFNYWRDELIGKPIEMLVPDRIAKKDSGFRQRILNASQTMILGDEDQWFGCRKDGSEFPVEIGLNPVRTPQGLLVLATVVDISGRKTAEEEARKHREEVTRLSRISLLGEMTASIAHELNQPLAGITSNANAAQRFMDRGKADPDQIREILVDIAADARRASNVIQHVRNTIKKGAALRERIDLNEVAGHVAHMLRPDARLHSCDVTLSLTKDLPAIEGDPLEIQQVLINLVSNAFDAMDRIPPEQRIVEIATEKNGEGTVEVSVRDQGPGISEDVRDRLFEQFFTTKDEGLGMGLAIVRSIIEAHRGKISAENLYGGGARFYFVLPAAEK